MAYLTYYTRPYFLSNQSSSPDDHVWDSRFTPYTEDYLEDIHNAEGSYFKWTGPTEEHTVDLNIDWERLTKQKEHLVSLSREVCRSDQSTTLLQGLVHLLDFLQDEFQQKE